MIFTKEKLKAFKNSQLLEGRESFTGVVKDINDNVFYYLNGKLHRTDGPAVESCYGTKKWYLNDKLHRTDGPAIIWYNGDKEWYLDGKHHRTDGPAIEWNNRKSWWLNGERYGWGDNFTNESWIRFVTLNLLK